MRFCWLLMIVVALSVVHPAAQSGHLRDVIRTLLKTIELRPEDRVLAGKTLEPVAAAALADVVRTMGLRETSIAPGSGVPADHVAVESVRIDGRRASARLIYGPVPAPHALQCGQEITFALRRNPGWTVEDDKTWARCSSSFSRGPQSRRELMLEAIRLALTRIELPATVRIAAGARLSPDVRTVLTSIQELPDAKQYATDEYVLLANAFAIHAVQMKDGVVAFEGTLGPVPRHAALACGTTWTIELRRRAAGWFFANTTVSVC